MLLDLIIAVFLWVGIMMNTFSLFLPKEWNFLPWNWVGVVFFCCAIGLVRWRGATTTLWLGMDFPTANADDKIGVTFEGSRMYLQRVQKSVANFLKNKKDWYYRDGANMSYSVGGHDARLLDSETAYCTNIDNVVLVNKLENDFYDYSQMKDVVKKEMQQLKNKQGNFLLTGTANPIPYEDIDVDSNKMHKELFEHLIDQYFVKVHGRAFSLKNYHRFQEKQAAPYQIGAVIHYVKALTAMKAAGVKKSMGGWGKWLIIIAVVIIIVLVMGLVMTGTIKIPGLKI